MKYKLIMGCIIFFTSMRVSAQWEVKSGTNFLSKSHIEKSKEFGFNLEPMSGTYGYYIENNGNGNNQQAFYFGHANGDKNIFGISASSNTGENWNSRFVINQNGNIGIGTNTPLYKVDIRGAIGIDNGYIVLNPTNNSTKKMAIRNAYGGLFIYNDFSNYSYGFYMDEEGSIGIGTTNTSASKFTIEQKSGDDLNSGIRLRNSSNGQSSFIWMDSKDDLHIDNSINSYRDIILNNNGTGRVGIGTDEFGSHKLTVEGSIGAREIKIQTGVWSDFVFEEDYHLPTLEEVEKHIKEKGHLKDIPSAMEVKENGVFLGEMDAKLLQKIEELTLYVIELNKKIIEQEKIIKKLKNENELQ